MLQLHAWESSLGFAMLKVCWGCHLVACYAEAVTLQHHAFGLIQGAACQRLTRPAPPFDGDAWN